MSDWSAVPLGEIAVVVDCEHKTAPSATSGEEYGYSVGTPHLRGGRIDYAAAKRVSEKTFQAWGRRAVPGAGDLILAREAPVGQVALVDPSRPTCLGQRTVLIRRFLHGYLLGRDAQIWMSDRSSGSTVEHLNVADVRKIPVALPSIQEQRHIACVLDAFDEVIASDRQLLRSAVDLAKAVYERAVADSDHVVALREAGQWLSGGTPSTSNPSYWGGDVPWISASSMHSFFVATSGRTLTPEGTKNGTRVVPKGTILFVVRGMSLKTDFRIGVAQREVAFGQDCKAIMVDESLPASTIAVGLLSLANDVLGLVDEASHGTGRLQTDRIENLAITLPRPELVAQTEATLTALLELGSESERSMADLTRARDELLPLLMSGKVRVSQDLAMV